MSKELFGLAAEFNSPEEIIAAAEKASAAGYKKMDAYTPFPIEDLPNALGQKETRLGWVVLSMALIGALTGFFMQYYANTHYYPLNAGGKPLNSWPNFVIITFEFTILFSAFTSGLFMLGRNGLPRPYHPIFNLEKSENITGDKFVLCIEARDKNFSLDKTKDFLASLNPNYVEEVEL